MPEHTKTFDAYTLKAAEIFKVKPEDVTKEQRQHAKNLSYWENYTVRGPLFLFSPRD